jgi:predicted nuclease with TOPRIM domain
MAGKSPTELYELIRDLQEDNARLTERFNLLNSSLDALALVAMRERQAVFDAAVAELKKWRDESERRGERLAVLEAQHAELKKQFDEKDRRWWQFWVGVGLVGVTFVANLVIQLVLLFSRKTV